MESSKEQISDQIQSNFHIEIKNKKSTPRIPQLHEFLPIQRPVDFQLKSARNLASEKEYQQELPKIRQKYIVNLKNLINSDLDGVKTGQNYFNAKQQVKINENFNKYFSQQEKNSEKKKPEKQKKLQVKWKYKGIQIKKFEPVPTEVYRSLTERSIFDLQSIVSVPAKERKPKKLEKSIDEIIQSKNLEIKNEIIKEYENKPKAKPFKIQKIQKEPPKYETSENNRDFYQRALSVQNHVYKKQNQIFGNKFETIEDTSFIQKPKKEKVVLPQISSRTPLKQHKSLPYLEPAQNEAAFENLYRSENLSAHKRQEALKVKALEKGINLYKIKSLKNSQMTIDQANSAYQEKHKKLNHNLAILSGKKSAHGSPFRELFRDSFCVTDVKCQSSKELTLFASNRNHINPSNLLEKQEFAQDVLKIQDYINKNERSISPKKNPMLAYLVRANNNNLIPKMGPFQREKNEKEELEYSVTSFKINEKFSNAFGQGLKNVEQKISLNLHANDLTDKNLAEIMTENVKEMTISNNPRLTEISFKQFGNLHMLSLENNKIGDFNLKYLLTIKNLNLSKNNITCLGAQILSDFQGTSLLLHWNKIRGKGAISLFKSYKKNKILKELDLSFNSIASIDQLISSTKKLNEETGLKVSVSIAEIPKSIYKLGKFLSGNKTLEHLDLSQNQILDKNSIIWLQQSLAQNHSIRGLHFQSGNSGFVDPQGYLNYIEMNENIKHGRIPNISDNCWLCGSWKPHNFTFSTKVNTSDKIVKKQRLMYLNIKNLDKSLMKEQRKRLLGVKYRFYSLARMLPPGEKNESWATDVDGNIFHCPSSSEEVALTILPRSSFTEPLDIPKIIWTKENSIFKAFKPDSPQLMSSCFHFDWNCSKLPKILSQNQDEIYQILQEFYPSIKNVYKYYSSLVPAVPCIGSNNLTDIIFNCPGLLDRQNLILSTVDLKFVQTNATKVQIKNLKTLPFLNPSKFLVRYQFLEFVVLIAMERYKNLKPKQQIEKLISENLKPFFGKFNSQKFRQILWCQECDGVFKMNKNLLQTLYKGYSGKYAQPGDKIRYMTVTEFIHLTETLGIIEDSQKSDSTLLSSRDVPIIFYLSMMTRVDELTNQQYLNMQFVEFLEALARLAEKAPMDTEYANFVGILQNYNEKQIEINQKSKLAIRIHLLLQKMAKMSLGEEFAKKYSKKPPLQFLSKFVVPQEDSCLSSD